MKAHKQFVYDRRLTKLATFLKKVPKKLFDLAVITTFSGDDCKPFSSVVKEGLEGLVKKDLKCGAAACAIGWCPAVFPRLCRWDSSGEVAPRDDKSYYSSFRTAEAMFGLDTAESAYLFDPVNYDDGGDTTAKQVAERILDFVKYHPNIDFNDSTQMWGPVLK